MWKAFSVLPLLAALAAPVLAEPAEETPSRRAAARAPQNARRTPVVEAVEKAAPAVVSIGTTRIVKFRYYDWLTPRIGEQEQRGLGSGVIVHPSGYVVTNAHVINQADQILVKLTGARESEPDISATLVAADPEHDLALLRLEKPGPYPYVEFGRSSDLMLGETVIAIGNPFGLGRTVTTGIVSALNRSLDVRDAKFEGFIQTDAAVNRGNSGGPLLNIEGSWIGVNSAIYSLGGGSDGISFAIPVDTVRQFVVRSLRPGRAAGAWLGMRFSERSDGAVYVDKVYAEGPAEKVGVTAGCRVRLEGDLTRLCFDALEAAKRGSLKLDLVSSNGQSLPTTVPFEAAPTERLAWERVGVRFREVDAGLSDKTDYAVGSGLVVLEVREGGPADRVGIERGDLLTTLGDAPIGSADALLDVLLEEKRGAMRDMKFVRPSRTRLEPWKARISLE